MQTQPRQLTAEQSEALRQAALEAMQLRHPAGVTAAGVARAIETEVMFSFEETAMESALEFLRDKGFVKFVQGTLGSTKWWTITAEGLRHIESAAR